jgi:hypothetical protein
MIQETEDLVGEFLERQLALLPWDPVETQTTVIDLSWESFSPKTDLAVGEVRGRLTQDQIDQMCMALEAFSGKVSLKLRNQDLDDLKLMRITPLLSSKNVKIVELDISGNCKLSRNSLETFARVVAGCPTIRILHLGGLKGGNLAKESILNAVIENQGIFEVDLGVICNSSLVGLATKLQFLPHLRRLSFAEGPLIRLRLLIHR